MTGLRLLVVAAVVSVAASAASAAPSALRLLGDGAALTKLHFIGDLHGDVGCARAWVARTGAVDLESTPWRWTGRGGGGADDEGAEEDPARRPTAPLEEALVFLGDYVDKGDGARATLEFVRALEAAFPGRARRSARVALLGHRDGYTLAAVLCQRRPILTRRDTAVNIHIGACSRCSATTTSSPCSTPCSRRAPRDRWAARSAISPTPSRTRKSE